ncbi:hypothetical protein QYM36_007787 [Artemia franciscana]|uniref:Uncharacterized protein n=1 Tax=Artemia franciscana TaxID=6661 RepID=A0AA88LD54_ARTSF|nr:hypothetical protein QYM36_007787 [Artemia franciscana]
MEDIQAVWNTASCYIPTEEKRSKWWQRISTSISSASSSGKYFDQEFFRQKLNFVEEYSDKLTCKKSVVIALLLQYLHYEPKLHGLNEEKTLEYFAEFLQDNLETNARIHIKYADDLICVHALWSGRTLPTGEISQACCLNRTNRFWIT